MKNEKRTVLCFPFSYENEKRMKLLKIQRKNLLNMKMVVNYLNFVFLIEVKAKSKYRIFEFRFSKTRNGTLGTRIIRVPKVPFSFFDKLKNEIQNSIYLDFAFTLIKKTKFK